MAARAMTMAAGAMAMAAGARAALEAFEGHSRCSRCQRYRPKTRLRARRRCTNHPRRRRTSPCTYEGRSRCSRCQRYKPNTRLRARRRRINHPRRRRTSPCTAMAAAAAVAAAADSSTPSRIRAHRSSNQPQTNSNQTSFSCPRTLGQAMLVGMRGHLVDSAVHRRLV